MTTHLHYMGLLKAFHSYFHPVLDGVSTGMRSSRGKRPRIRDSIARISEAFIVFIICISSAVRARGSSFLFASMYKWWSTCRKMSIAFFIHSNFLSISASLFCRRSRWCRSHARSIVSCACFEGMARWRARPTSGRHVPVGVDRLRTLLGYRARLIICCFGSPACSLGVAYVLAVAWRNLSGTLGRDEQTSVVDMAESK
jgi:hypothetical protein